MTSNAKLTKQYNAKMAAEIKKFRALQKKMRVVYKAAYAHYETEMFSSQRAIDVYEKRIELLETLCDYI